MISAQVLITRPCESTTDWLKLKPFRLLQNNHELCENKT
jgi:hypothetical protein